ncbi:Nephrocystin-3 [Ceratocystis lukuohia]|uniref:Nephrocystin-3 n=1 Tax=Ceratocystis lukuohia TaxID=2019550 RepID=A0ABR4MCU3_9PEZI
MSSSTQPHKNAQPFKILSLDDGDVGGLSSLLILENIMENIRDTEGRADIPKPCDIFDLIGGTGTGGIIAIMLGRLDLECVKTVVLATTKVNMTADPRLFKTYQATASLTKCKIWEVGRATSAMTGLFAPIDLGRDKERFMNSSFGYSNPCKILIEEARKLLSNQPEPEMLILSIGTGLSGVVEMGDDEISLANALKKIAANSRGTADELERTYHGKKERYHRFDTANTQGAILASNRLKPSDVAAHSQNYIKEKQHDIQSFAQVLINGFPPVSEKQEVVQELQPPQQPQTPKKSDSDGSYNETANFTMITGIKLTVFTDPVAVYHIPFHENLQFVGRQDVLSKLDNRLFTHTGFQQVALVGLGGMGKTQVALKFAYTVKEKYTDCSVFWVTAASIDGFRNSCKELTATLGIETSDGDDPRILVKDYLDANKCGKWLLILDNVDDNSLFNAVAKESRISDFLPQSREGRIMFTTRSRTVSWLAVKSDSLELEEMSSEELTTILMRSMEVHNDQSYIHDEHSINELLDELCHLPLAVAQAADYMAINQIPVAEYLELLRDSNEEKVELLTHHHPDNVHLEDSQGAVATTWLITFRQIQKTSSDAVDLLRFIAKVEAKAIPQTMLPGSENKKSVVDAIGILLAYGFIRKQKTNDLFDMHSLVHLTTQLWSEGLGDDEEHSLTVFDHMASIFPSDEWENRFLWRQYLPHALRVLGNKEASGESVTELEFKVGLCLCTDGNFRSAVELFEHVVNVREALAADDPSRLVSQHELARAYLNDGQIKKAISMFEHVVDVNEALATDHPHRLAYQHGLARAYLGDGQIKKAISMFEHVMNVNEALATDHPHRLASQHSLARAYLRDGQIKKAISMFEHVVDVQKALAADHPSRLTSQHELAAAYLDDGQIKKAISMFEHVVNVREALAADDPSRLVSQHELAQAYLDDGQIKKAIPMFEHVVKTDEKALAADNPNRLKSQHWLAQAYLRDGQIKKAISMLEHVVELDKISSTRNLKHRLQAQELLEQCLTRRPDSRDLSG